MNIKTTAEISLMRENGNILSVILSILNHLIKPGVAVYDLEEAFIEMCVLNQVHPSCKGYTERGALPPFPTGLCVSINNQSVHCFPKKDEFLRHGDIVTIDTVIDRNGYHSDAAFAKVVGLTDPKKQTLVDCSRNAMLVTEKLVKPGVFTGDLGNAMFTYVKSKGFNVLRDYAGHGIGKEMHEEPEIPCFGNPGTGVQLESGMTICIESLVCEGDSAVSYVSDWETKMKDGKNFAQFEHTVLVTPTGYDILTPFEV